MKTFQYFITSTILYLLLSTSGIADTNLHLPTDAFGSLPDVSQVELSPSGDKIVARVLIDTPEVKGTAYRVTNLKSKESKMVLFTDNQKFDLNWVKWKTNDVLLAGIIYPDTRINFGPNSETRETDIIVVNLKTGETHNLFKSSFFGKFKFKPAGRDDIVDMLFDDPDHVLISIRGRKMDTQFPFPRVYKVNVNNQRAKIYQEIEGRVIYWLTDQQHRVRLMAKFFDHEFFISVKDSKNKKWRELWQYRNYSEDNVTPLGFGKDPNMLYVRAYEDGNAAVYSVDVTDPELKMTTVYKKPGYDVDGGLIYSRITNDVIGISSSYGDATVYISEEQKKLQNIVNKALPNTHNYLYSFSEDESSYLVFAESDIESGTYLIGNRQSGSLDVIAYRYKNLPPELMSPKRKWNYTARDGEKIEAFLTLPKGAEEKNLPTVIFPHGGPVAYDDHGFDYWVQFFVSRGYAVLQPNFRGSSGQGFKFRNAGIKDSEVSMMDIEDGTRALIKEGIANREKLCIVGASYGGYAAMYGAVKSPDLYTCAISFAGLSDVSDRLVLNDETRLIRGGPDADKLSPINYVKQAKAPILLIHGEHDRQVDVSHSQRMYKALQKKGKKVKYIELKDEDHYLTSNENRKTTFREMDEFLSTYAPID